MTKMGRDINKYCKQNNLTNVVSKLKKIGGKSKQAWIGIRMIEEEENPNEC